MDDSGAELVKAATEGVTKGAVSGGPRARVAVSDTLAGAPIRESSGWITDLVRFQRWKTEVRILKKAEEFLAAEGIDPQRVPLKTLVPLLQLSSLEEEGDEFMQDRWAALLANAAAGRSVPPSFPQIRAELSSADAVMLELVYDEFESIYQGLSSRESGGEKLRDAIA